MHKPILRTIAIQGLQVDYLEYGQSTGTPLILLHGFPDAPLAWQCVIDRLEIDNLRILAPYLRGFGGTHVTKLDLLGGQEAALGNDLLSFADALEIDTFHLAGHDWGARASYAACVFAPQRIRSLLTLATPYVMYGGRDYPPAQVRGNWYQWYFQLDLGRKILAGNAKEFCHELWTSWSPEWKFSEKEFEQAAAAWKNPQFVATVLHYYRTRWGGALGLRAYAELQVRLDAMPKAKIVPPSIYVQGAADACGLAECSIDQASYFSGPYERVLLGGIGHFPHREDPGAIAKLLQRQLEQYV